MSEDMAASMTNHSTPDNAGAKREWVKFEDAAEDPNGGGSPSKTGGNKVTSARGSVKSLEHAQQLQMATDATSAQLPISEIQVVNEHTLRKNSTAIDPLRSKNSHGNNGPAGDSSNMDSVNLNDSDAVNSPSNQIRMSGKRFYNGEVIVTLLPVNKRFPWVVPASFRPELVPEELMAPVLTLTVEEYVQTMERLTTDMRFTLFNIFYKRILIIWITLAFIVLLVLLFSGFQGIWLFACGVAWLIFNAAAIFLCMWVKLKLNKQLEKCMAFINKNLIKHNIILGLDDRGRLSCQKVNLCFVYFEPQDCIKKLESILEERSEESVQNGGQIFDRESYLKNVERFEDVEVVVQGRAPKSNRKRERAEKLFLHYLQRWAKDYLRRRLDWIVDDLYGRQEYQSNSNPRHIRSALCPCQYIEEHLRNKRHRESLNPCTLSSNPCLWCD